MHRKGGRMKDDVDETIFLLDVEILLPKMSWRLNRREVVRR